MTSGDVTAILFPSILHHKGSVTEWMNKEKQKATARSVGLNVVHSFNIEISKGNYHIPTDIRFPCFTKTKSYLPGCKHTLHRCDNKDRTIGKILTDFKNQDKH